jgi:hypothetical protein
MIAWLITSRLGRYMALAVAVLLAIVTFGASERRKGRSQAERDARDAINEARNNARKIADETGETIDGMHPDDIKRVLGERYRRD